MKFTRAAFDGIWIIDAEPHADERGSFARIFAAEELEQHGLEHHFVHINCSINVAAGTIRGLHYQCGDDAEAKIVRCTRGSVFDVAVDVRPDSSTRYKWYGIELSASRQRQVYIPKGFAHGFQVLEPDTELTYLVSHDYVPQAERGLRWDDPTLAIDWPCKAPPVVSEKDRSWTLIRDA